MTYKGTVKNGAVVLEVGVQLSEGLEVQVTTAPFVAVAGLLDEPSLDDALDKLHFLYKVHRGLEQADAGQTVSHDEARERLAKWLD